MEKVTLSDAQIDDLRVALVVAHYEANKSKALICSGDGSSKGRAGKATEVQNSTSTISVGGSLGVVSGARDEGERDVGEVSEQLTVHMSLPSGGGWRNLRGLSGDVGTPAAVGSTDHGP